MEGVERASVDAGNVGVRESNPGFEGGYRQIDLMPKVGIAIPGEIFIDSPGDLCRNLAAKNILGYGVGQFELVEWRKPEARMLSHSVQRFRGMAVTQIKSR